MEIAFSVNDVPIRLTDERWTHIVENHDDLAGRREDVLQTVEEPEWVTKGYKNSLIAWKGIGKKRFIAVVYKELSPNDGFILLQIFPQKQIKGTNYGHNNDKKTRYPQAG